MAEHDSHINSFQVKLPNIFTNYLRVEDQRFKDWDHFKFTKEPPIISYTYTKTIANKIFNFSSTLSDLDYHQFHNNPSQCECNTSSHLYQPYGHVITGDLSIIPNFKLRDLIAKGPKYREPCKVDWDKNLSLLCEAVDQYAL